MYRIECDPLHYPNYFYHQQFMNKQDAINKAKELIFKELEGTHPKVLTCRVTSLLHPNEVIVVRKDEVHTYYIPKTL